MKEEAERRERRKAKGKKEAPLAASNSEQEPPAHSDIAQPKGRSVVSEFLFPFALYLFP